MDINILRLRQNGRHFPDDIFKCIFLNENVLILMKISLKFVPKGPININPGLVQIMAWRLPGVKPLSEPMMVSLLMHICVTRPQWVKQYDIKLVLLTVLYWDQIVLWNYIDCGRIPTVAGSYLLSVWRLCMTRLITHLPADPCLLHTCQAMIGTICSQQHIPQPYEWHKPGFWDNRITGSPWHHLSDLWENQDSALRHLIDIF